MEAHDGPGIIPYLIKKAGYLATESSSYLLSEFCLNDPRYRLGWQKTLRALHEKIGGYGPLTYDISNESALTYYNEAFDLCFSPETLGEFRNWLKLQYGSLEALNTEWRTSFSSWDRVVPYTTAEAQRSQSYPPWADHRTFMEINWARTITAIKDFVHSLDPHAFVGISNTQGSAPSNGMDYSRIEQAVDFIRGGAQYKKSFKRGLRSFGSSGYAGVGASARSRIWRSLLIDGDEGTSNYWHYHSLFPDLTLTPGALSFGPVYREIRSGIGKLWIEAERRPGRTAIFYSMPSQHGVWITD